MPKPASASTVMAAFRVVAAAAVVVATLLLSGTASGQPDFERMSATSLNVYRPFTADGRLAPGLTVARTTRGDCWVGSIASRRRDAWRCSTRGGLIYDPCFEDLTGTAGYLVCPAFPSSGRVVRLTLTKPLDNSLAGTGSPSARRGLPWAVLLGNGARCELFTGTVATVRGRDAYYGCGWRAAQGFVVGRFRRASAGWTVLYARTVEARPIRVGVRAAWW